MEKEILIQPHPHKYQHLFLSSPARYRALISGIGGGKTRIGCVESLRLALKHAPCTGAIIAPTYRMLSDVTVKTFMEICPPELIREWNKSEYRLVLTGGSDIIFRSADEADKLRGPNLGWFYIDEAALVSRKVWEIMIGRLRRQPERGWITTTPKGFNWIYDEFVKVKKPDHWYVSYSTLDNPYISQSFIDSIKSSYSGAFLQQELYGDFVGFEGLVYPDFQRKTHVVDKTPSGLTYYAACDFGFTNPSVLLAVGVDSDDRIYVVEELYQRNMTPETYIKCAKELHSKYKFQDCACDPSSPDYIHMLNEAGIPALGVKSSIMDGISLITQRLQKAGDQKPRLYVHERCVNTIMEFESYQYPEGSEDRPTVEQPLKVNDHAQDALRYLTYYLTKQHYGLNIIGSIGDEFSGRQV